MSAGLESTKVASVKQARKALSERMSEKFLANFSRTFQAHTTLRVTSLSHESEWPKRRSEWLGLEYWVQAMCLSETVDRIDGVNYRFNAEMEIKLIPN